MTAVSTAGSPAGRTIAAAARWAPMLAAVGFAMLALDVLLHGPLSHLDPLVSDWSAQHRHPPLTSLMLAVTALHSTMGIDLMTGVLVLALLATGRRWQPLAVLVWVQGAMLLNVGVKLAVHRGRPEAQHALVHLGTYSFPSGHALAATVWWGVVVWLAWPHCRATAVRSAALALAVVLVALVATSRVYLGAHYLTDVLAGCAEGVAWIGLCRWVVEQGGDRFPRRR